MNHQQQQFSPINKFKTPQRKSINLDQKQHQGLLPQFRSHNNSLTRGKPQKVNLFDVYRPNVVKNLNIDSGKQNLNNNNVNQNQIADNQKQNIFLNNSSKQPGIYTQSQNQFLNQRKIINSEQFRNDNKLAQSSGNILNRQTISHKSASQLDEKIELQQQQITPEQKLNSSENQIMSQSINKNIQGHRRIKSKGTSPFNIDIPMTSSNAYKNKKEKKYRSALKQKKRVTIQSPTQEHLIRNNLSKSAQVHSQRNQMLSGLKQRQNNNNDNNSSSDYSQNSDENDEEEDEYDSREQEVYKSQNTSQYSQIQNRIQNINMQHDDSTNLNNLNLSSSKRSSINYYHGQMKGSNFSDISTQPTLNILDNKQIIQELIELYEQDKTSEQFQKKFQETIQLLRQSQSKHKISQKFYDILDNQLFCKNTDQIYINQLNKQFSDTNNTLQLKNMLEKKLEEGFVYSAKTLPKMIPFSTITQNLHQYLAKVVKIYKYVSDFQKQEEKNKENIIKQLTSKISELKRDLKQLQLQQGDSTMHTQNLSKISRVSMSPFQKHQNPDHNKALQRANSQQVFSLDSSNNRPKEKLYSSNQPHQRINRLIEESNKDSNTITSSLTQTQTNSPNNENEIQQQQVHIIGKNIDEKPTKPQSRQSVEIQELISFQGIRQKENSGVSNISSTTSNIYNSTNSNTNFNNNHNNNNATNNHHSQQQQQKFQLINMEKSIPIRVLKKHFDSSIQNMDVSSQTKQQNKIIGKYILNKLTATPIEEESKKLEDLEDSK